MKTNSIPGSFSVEVPYSEPSGSNSATLVDPSSPSESRLPPHQETDNQRKSMMQRLGISTEGILRIAGQTSNVANAIGDSAAGISSILAAGGLALDATVAALPFGITAEALSLGVGAVALGAKIVGEIAKGVESGAESTLGKPKSDHTES